MQVDYYKCDPGGNITAIVITLHKREDYVLISRETMKRDKDVEQVGFLEDASEADFRLQMMGGEFCGNASRCAAMVFPRKRLSMRIEVSGASRPLDVCIKGDVVELGIPISSLDLVSPVEFAGIKGDFVELEGITFCVFV